MKTQRTALAAASSLWVLVASASTSVLGPTYEIAEPDTLTEIHQRAVGVNWSVAMTKKDPSQYSAFKGASLPRATRYVERFFDPTYVLPFDLKNADGRLLFPQGTRVNVYERLKLPGRYIVIDASPSHMRWLEETARPTATDRILVANGSVYGMRTRKDYKFFVLDPRGIERFGLQAVPAIVEQSGTKLKVTEYVPET